MRVFPVRESCSARSFVRIHHALDTNDLLARWIIIKRRREYTRVNVYARAPIPFFRQVSTHSFFLSTKTYRLPRVRMDARANLVPSCTESASNNALPDRLRHYFPTVWSRVCATCVPVTAYTKLPRYRRANDTLDRRRDRACIRLIKGRHLLEMRANLNLYRRWCEHERYFIARTTVRGDSRVLRARASRFPFVAADGKPLRCCTCDNRRFSISIQHDTWWSCNPIALDIEDKSAFHARRFCRDRLAMRYTFVDFALAAPGASHGKINALPTHSCKYSDEITGILQISISAIGDKQRFQRGP